MKVKAISQLNTTPPVLDSHAGVTAFSRLEADRRSFRVVPGKNSYTVSDKIYYSRIRRLPDGSYFMLHQDGRVSANVWFSRSLDGLHWSDRKPLFTSHPVIRDDMEKDKLCYCNGDLLVLDDGELLVFASYRYNAGYSLDAKYSGIVMKRTKDNGASWSDEELIYLGRNWEASPLLLPSGEIQLYFSHTAPKFYLDKTVRTDSRIHTSSGSAMIRSFDRGHTWTPDVKGAPYEAHRVTQNYVETMENGTMIFTNQMPVAAALHNGGIALAAESDMALGRFLLTMSYTDDNWARPLGIDEDGPEDKLPVFTFGAGPYLVQMDSGETVLSYNTADQFHLRLGDADGKDMQAEERDQIAFDGLGGYWGCLCVDGSHSLLAAMPNVREDRTQKPWVINNDMMFCRYYLNHRIDACRMREKDALTDEGWEENTDALFLGAGGDSQMSLRVGYDEAHLYLRIDRLDRDPSPADGEAVYLRMNGRVVRVERKGSIIRADADGVALSADCVADSVTEGFFSERGNVVLISLPCSTEGQRELRVYAELTEGDGATPVTYGFTGVKKEDHETWFPVVLA